MLGSTFIPQTLLPLRPEQRQGSGARNKHLKMNLQSAVREGLTLGDTTVDTISVSLLRSEQRIWTGSGPLHGAAGQGHSGNLWDSFSPSLLESLVVPALHFWCSNPLPRASLCVADKPLPQSAPGGIIGIVGGVIAAVFIIGVAVTVIIVYRRQQKSRSDTDNDL